MLGPRRQACAGGIAAAGRAARDRRDRPDHARQRARPVADAPPVDSRGRRARAARSSGTCRRWNASSVLAVSYRARGPAACAGRQRSRHPRLPRAAGGVEQRRAPFGRDRRRGSGSRVDRRRARAGSRGPWGGIRRQRPRAAGLGLVGDARARGAGRRHDRVQSPGAAAGRSSACACRSGRVADDSPQSRMPIASPSCSPTTTASCAAASGGCSKTIRRIAVVGEASNGDEAVALAAEPAAARRRHGLRDAGHERPRGHAADSRGRARRRPC